MSLYLRHAARIDMARLAYLAGRFRSARQIGGGVVHDGDRTGISKTLKAKRLRGFHVRWNRLSVIGDLSRSPYAGSPPLGCCRHARTFARRALAGRIDERLLDGSTLPYQRQRQAETVAPGE